MYEPLDPAVRAFAAAEARIRLGRAWGDLAVQKDTHGDYTRTVS